MTFAEAEFGGEASLVHTWLIAEPTKTESHSERKRDLFLPILPARNSLLD